MLQSELFPKTKKEPPKDAASINHKLLVRAGFIDQLMAGSWTLLPLGYRVVTKINQIIREEMNAIGAQEMLMPLLHPKSIWNETGRWDKADEIMYKLKDTRSKEYVLSFTHEEIVMDLLRKNIKSYADLPVAVYHFSTKFRHELRAKSGILRGREFMMKDLYSAHISEEDLMKYYGKVKEAYKKIFERIGFDFRVTEASGGVFTDRSTHEFQVLSDAGEDTIYFCDECGWGVNKEIADFQLKVSEKKCPSCGKQSVKEAKSIEVGNIFPLGTWYAERMRMYYTDSEGMKKPVWFGSYGIGPTRTMGAWVEESHDDKGIIWNKVLTPFDVHLLDIKTSDKENSVKEIYERLQNAGIEVLYDDRNISAGEKFSDADLLGIPVRLVTSNKIGERVEFKERSKDNTEIFSLDELLNKLSLS